MHAFGIYFWVELGRGKGAGTVGMGMCNHGLLRVSLMHYFT